MKPRSLATLLASWISLVLASPEAVQAADASRTINAENQGRATGAGSTGVIEGRVLNPATREYLGNAQIRVQGTDLTAVSSVDGRFRVVNVPNGSATVIASYSGYQPSSATVTVLAGEVVRHDFDLQSASVQGDAKLVTLDRFTVKAEREGNARAIMEQRSAMTVKEVVTADSFGPIADGNIQHALQFMAGVNLTSGVVFLNGMNEKYGAFLVDGVRMSGATRAMEPRSYSSHGSDTIEFNKTNSADMDADAPAGSINLRSKSGFQRSGRYFAWEAYVIHSVYNSLTLGKVNGPNDGRSRPLKPSLVLDYSDVYFDGKLAVALNYGETNGDSTGFGFNAGFVNTTYDTVPTAANPSPVVISNVTWGGGGGSNLRRGGSMNLEYKLTPAITLALRGQFAWEDNRQQNFQLSLIAPRANQSPSANELRMIANPTTNNAVRFNQTGAVSYRIRNTHSFAPQLIYRGKRWEVDATLAYNREGSYLANRRLTGDGFNEVQSAVFQLFGVGWNLEKEAPDSHVFTFAQTAGPDLYDLHNWRATSTTNNITRAPNETVTRRKLGQFNAKFTTSWKIPTWFKTGLKIDRQEFFNTSGSYTWTYVGATGNPLTTEIPISVAWPDARMGGNIFERKVPVADRLILGTWLKERPEYFIPNPTNATSAANLFPNRSADETLTAGYLMGNSQFGRLTVQGGVRFESTENSAQNYEREEVTERSGRYEDPFFSGAVRYRFTENRMVIASFSQSIQRPNLNSMSGVLAVNDVSRTGTLPNPNLKPEHGNNFSIRLEQYFEPVGTFSVAYLHYDITDLHRSVPGIPAEDLGLEGDYPGYTFTALSNVGRFKNRGVQVAYRQQLSFLPGVLSGLGVFANYNQYWRSDPELAYRAAPKVIQGGVSFTYRRFNISGQAVWADELLQDAIRYRPPSLTLGLNAYFRLSDRISLTLSGRNIGRQKNIQHLRDMRGFNSSTQIQIPSIWILGIKGAL